MTDYLTRLLDRARGDAPRLERRIAQPFEASGDAGAPLFRVPALVSTETDATDESPAASTGRSVERVVTRSHERDDSIAASDHPLHGPSPSAPRARLDAVVVHVERRDEKPVSTPAHADATITPTAGRTRRAAPHALDAPTALMPAVRSDVPSREDEQARTRIEPRDTARQAPRSEDAPSRLVRSVPIIETGHARASRSVSETRAPFAPVASRLAPASVPVSRAAPAPTIHVSIGRVEVRAVPAPSSPRARSSEQSGPRLSLDAYLRSRAGGGT